MTKFILIIFLFSTFNGLTQLKAGFDKNEAKELIALCNSFTYLDLYGDDSKIIPEGYTRIYTSPSYGMDNLFQVYTHNTIGIIVFRGSTANMTSWLENMYAAMIPVKGKIKVDGDKFKYEMGQDDAGAIHAGYTLAISFFKDDLLKQIKLLNKQGIYDILITGHSQGGALAQLTRAYLDNVSLFKLSKKNKFKVYAYANPQIGNQSFCNEYTEKYCHTEMSYLIHNPTDFVIKMPISYDDSTFWKEQFAMLLQGDENEGGSNRFVGGLLNLFGDDLTALAKNMAESINKQLLAEFGEIEMPEFRDELNYAHTGNLTLIDPTEYPEGAVSKRNEKMYQHKPYNYYVSILKGYFPMEYERLEQKYFTMPEK